MEIMTNTNEAKLKDTVLIGYVLQALSPFAGITLLIGVIINYIKRNDANGTWLESHFRWQITTFWIYLCFVIIGGATIFILVGYLILLIGFIWLVYRICKGWIRLSENKPV
ncbi:MAG: hypothetical protein K0R14_140 [Burkholderiales bacterium]|jgi:uncharacterized membrane protein|nr:hypothetical protein [Burkholderiales bacterium]